MAPPPGAGESKVGLAVDSLGNLWVADTNNNRVLRFPFNSAQGSPAKQADLVLGQTTFTSNDAGTGFNQMNKPASIRVSSAGLVYVADSLNNRVLVFQSPFSNGQPASQLLGNSYQEPTGLEIDPEGGIWVADSGNSRLIRFLNSTEDRIIPASDVYGGIGIDHDGNILVTRSGGFQEVQRFPAPTYLRSDSIFQSIDGSFNQTGSRGLYTTGHGLEVAAGQLIYGDGPRILFWNEPWNLTNYKPADGVVGQANFQSRPQWSAAFFRMRADQLGRLWVVSNAIPPANLYGYQLPLTTGASPVITITSPIPLQGGGVFTWTEGLVVSGVATQRNCDCVWLSDEDSHRVFRIRNISTQPVVDVVLGQKNNSQLECNQGRGRNLPSRDSLCHPGALAFDNDGNLFVADHNLEFDGNLRLLEWDADQLPLAPSVAAFGLPASHVLGRNDDFSEPNCLPLEQDPICGPWEPAFDSQGRMVIGFNGYLGPRFLMVYQSPLINKLPIAVVGDFHSMPLSARFDQFDNLYVIDHNRSRILIYKNRSVQMIYLPMIDR